MENNIDCQGDPVTSSVPMLYDETEYKLYILLHDDICNLTEIKAVSKVCSINFLQVKNKLTSKRTLIVEGRAYTIRDILQILLKYDVKFEIDPPYPYNCK